MRNVLQIIFHLKTEFIHISYLDKRLIWRKSCKICYLEWHDTHSYYASLGLGSHVIYIYTLEAVPIDRQSVVCDWFEAGVARCCCSHARSSVVGYASLITTDSIRLHKTSWASLPISCARNQNGIFIFLQVLCGFPWARMAQSVLRLAMSFTARGSNPSAFFHTRPDWPWGQPSLQYKRSLPVIQRPGGVGLTARPPSTAEVKERVELYLYSSCGFSWHVVRWTPPFPAVSYCQYHFNENLYSCSASGGKRIFGSRDKQSQNLRT